MKPVTIIIKDDPICCNCGSMRVKAYKVHSEGEWWSRCLDCKGYFTDSGKYDPPPTPEEQKEIDKEHDEIVRGYVERLRENPIKFTTHTGPIEVIDERTKEKH